MIPPRMGKSGSRSEPRRRGMLLVVVLVIITVLAVLGTSFSYLMNADLQSVQAMMDRQQARLAAEAGIDRAILLLRTQRQDTGKWYNNPQAFRRILVWAPDQTGGSESLADQEKIEGRPAWRFSIVASEQEGQRTRIRYGLVDESSKLNINLATREQLLRLFDVLVQVREIDLGPSDPADLADAIIDWRDPDDTPNSARGAESDYYMRLEPPYRAKNRPFETVEELLMVKGFNGRILYGEDYNRNGYLDANEDDGEEGAFPPDNGDGILSRGILPYITCWSWDFNTGADNRYRININMLRNADLSRLPPHIAREIDASVLEFISQALRRGYRFRSVGELLGLKVYEDGSSNYDALWRQYARERRRANSVAPPGNEEADGQGAEIGGPPEEADGERSTDAGGTGDPGGRPGGGRQNAGSENERDRRDRGDWDRDNRRGGRDEDGERRDGRDRRPGAEEDSRGDALDQIDREIEDARRGSGGNRGADRRNDLRREREDEEDARPGGPRRRSDPARERGGAEGEEDDDPGLRADDDRFGQTEDDDRVDRDRSRRPRAGRDGDDRDGADPEARGGRGDRDGRRGDRAGDRDRRSGPGRGPDAGSSGDGRGRPQERGEPLPNPITADMMPVLLDRLTTLARPVIGGLINVNTAPAVVLQTIPGITEQDAAAIVAQRSQLSAEELASPAWLVTSGALSPEKFALVSNLVTTRSIQYSVDVIGFADHVGAVARIQAVIEIKGQLAQVKYYRDISSLGLGYPVWDDQRSEGLAFDAR